MPIDNKEMVDHLGSCISLLTQEGILTNTAPRMVGELKASINSSWKKSGNTTWRYEMSDYIHFSPVLCPDSGKELAIAVRARIAVSPDADIPFLEWDICLEIDEDQGNGNVVPLSRWHFDLAHQTPTPQAGSQTHMQYGGNSPRHTGGYSPLKMPRWHHHPLDLLLMLEVVSANFFEEEWLSKIRDNPNWCDAINAAQKLCVKPVVDKMQSIMEISGQTILGEMWNRSTV